jgi:dGTPase
VPLFRGFHDMVSTEFPAAAPKVKVHEALRHMVDALVTDLLREVRARVAQIGATTLAEIRQAPERLVGLSTRMEAERATAKEFLYDSLYNSPGIEEVHAHATQVVEGLFAAIATDPGLLPADHRAQIPSQGLARIVADYIAGMTDAFIEETWKHVQLG